MAASKCRPVIILLICLFTFPAQADRLDLRLKQRIKNKVERLDCRVDQKDIEKWKALAGKIWLRSFLRERKGQRWNPGGDCLRWTRRLAYFLNQKGVPYYREYGYETRDGVESKDLHVRLRLEDGTVLDPYRQNLGQDQEFRVVGRTHSSKPDRLFRDQWFKGE